MREWPFVFLNESKQNPCGAIVTHAIKPRGVISREHDKEVITLGGLDCPADLFRGRALASAV